MQVSVPDRRPAGPNQTELGPIDFGPVLGPRKSRVSVFGPVRFRTENFWSGPWTEYYSPIFLKPVEDFSHPDSRSQQCLSDSLSYSPALVSSPLHSGYGHATKISRVWIFVRCIQAWASSALRRRQIDSLSNQKFDFKKLRLIRYFLWFFFRSFCDYLFGECREVRSSLLFNSNENEK